MSDLETLSLWLIRKDPAAATQFANDWDYWLVDEYQDTSPVQVELLQHLIGDRPCFVVGDPQQSIYLFRGARSEVFAQKEKEIKDKGGRTDSKMINFRSRPELLGFYNVFFSKLSPVFAPMQVAAQTDLPDWKEIPAAYYFECPPEPEAQYLAVIERCQTLIASGVAPEQICVLSRKNSELQALATIAVQRGLPVQVHSSAKFYSRREIIDALSLLKFLVNPFDNKNLLVLLRSPWFRVPDAHIASFCHRFAESYWLKMKVAKDFPALVHLADLLRLSEASGIRVAWEMGLQQSGLMDTSRVIDPTGRREANLWKLISDLRHEERRAGFRYLEFAERSEVSVLDIDENSEGDATPVQEPKRVNLMTVHASKGLQFQHVLLPSMGNFRPRKTSRFFIFDERLQKFSLGLHDPQVGKLESTAWSDRWLNELKKREIEEYDRVLYVALTRAKRTVSLFWSRVDKGSWAERMWIPGAEEDLSFKVDVQRNIQPLAVLANRDDGAKVPVAVLAKMEVTGQRSMPFVSVTSLVNQDTDSTNRSGGNPQTRVDVALNGVKIHRLFESLSYQPEIADWNHKDPAIEFVRTWENGKILDWIACGQVEWGFCIQFADHWIQGQIDLWTVDAEGILWVVDYKTGSERFQEKAFQQLEIYAWALRRMKKVNPQKTELAVVYPLSQKVYSRAAQSQSQFEKYLTNRLQIGEVEK